MKFITIIFLTFTTLYSIGQNLTDENSLKQGNWVFTKVDSQYVQTLSISINQKTNSEPYILIDTCKILKGNYVNGKKEGKWISYYCGSYRIDSVKAIVNFKKDTLLGEVQIFNKDFFYKGTIKKDEKKHILQCRPHGSNFWSNCEMKTQEILDMTNLKYIKN